MSALTDSLTKAEQSADLLLEDLRDITSLLADYTTQEEVIAWQYVIDLVAAAQDLRNRVHRVA